MDSIRLLGIRFHAMVGDLPHEREMLQPIEVDVEVMADLDESADTDSLTVGIDYRQVYQAVRDTISDDPEHAPRLLEALCARIADRIIALERVEKVRICCRKPWAALPGPVDRVEVEVCRP